MCKNYLYAGLLLLLPFQSCIDGNYDLSDMDTNVTVPVENLTLPLNMESLTLHTILDVDDDSQIKEHNGQYAVVVTGVFETEPITIDKFQLSGSSINDINSTTYKRRSTSLNRRKSRTSTSSMIASYELPTEKADIRLNGKDVSDAILSLNSLDINTKISTQINFDKNKSFRGILNQVRVENFTFKVPRGFEGSLKIITPDGKEIAADYLDSKTGIASFESSEIVTSDGTINLNFDVTGIDEGILNETQEQLTESNSFTIEDDFGVKGGEIAISKEDYTNRHENNTDEQLYDILPEEIGYSSEQVMDDIAVNDFTGMLDYAVENFDVTPVNLDEVPDMLTETGTYLNFTNPQLYLSIENPIEDGQQKTIPTNTGFEITAINKNGSSHTYTLDKNETIVADNRQNTFYLSPSPVPEEDKYDNYEQASHIKFSTLGNVLSGGNEETSEGIPVRLIIKAKDTRVKADRVSKFSLGKSFTPIHGNYTFYAPLSLTPGSRIRYNEIFDGWSSKELDDISISSLKVNCAVTTDVPFALDITMTPIDKNGNRMNAKATATIPANANEMPLEMVMEGDIRFLDGIVIDAVATSKSTDTLRPDMNIHMNGIRANITGKYNTEF